MTRPSTLVDYILISFEDGDHANLGYVLVLISNETLCLKFGKILLG
jgi:hypothetical protein